MYKILLPWLFYNPVCIPIVVSSNQKNICVYFTPDLLTFNTVEQGTEDRHVRSMKKVLNLQNTNSSPIPILFWNDNCSSHETSCKHDELALEIKLYNHNETLGNPGY